MIFPFFCTSTLIKYKRFFEEVYGFSDNLECSIVNEDSPPLIMTSN